MNIHERLIRFPKTTHKLLGLFLAGALLGGLLASCSAAPALAIIPVSGGDQATGSLTVTEYPLVEQSIDNPNHAGFEDRVPGAVRARREGPSLFKPEDALQAPNRTLAAFGYRLAPNPTPPFGAYALYSGDTLVQSGISRFWPVSLKQEGGTATDFLLAFETFSGEQHMASLSGVQPWPAAGQPPAGAPPAAAATSGLPPVYLKGDLAYAEVSENRLSVIADGEVLYSGAAATPRNLYTWGDHWALELDGRVILDGKDLNEQRGYDEIFHWTLLNQQPFYFFVKGGLSHLHYAGDDLPYTYDLIVHNSRDEAAAFNPGAGTRLVWFYALRDGLWYYVEVMR